MLSFNRATNAFFKKTIHCCLNEEKDKHSLSTTIQSLKLYYFIKFSGILIPILKKKERIFEVKLPKVTKQEGLLQNEKTFQYILLLQVSIVT